MYRLAFVALARRWSVLCVQEPKRKASCTSEGGPPDWMAAAGTRVDMGLGVCVLGGVLAVLQGLCRSLLHQPLQPHQTSQKYEIQCF